MGVFAAVGVALAVVIALTMLPAFMGLMGERLRPRKSRRGRGSKPTAMATGANSDDNATAGGDAPSTSTTAVGKGERSGGIFGWWVRTVTRVPLVTILVVVVGLGALAVPMKDLHLGLPTAAELPADNTARQTYDALEKKFGPGFNGPVIVTADIVTSTDPMKIVNGLKADIEKLPGVDTVAVAVPNQNADTAMIQVLPTTGPTDEATSDLVRELRDHKSEWHDKYGVDTAVTGLTAIKLDVSNRLGAALLPFGIFVVGLCLVLLTVVFRSIAVPIKATIGYLLSVLAAFGAAQLVFNRGIGLSVVNLDRPVPIISFMPIVVMGILFGLAMDYEVFLLARIKESDLVLLVGGDSRRRARGITLAVVPLALAGPWLLALQEQPRRLLTGWGMTDVQLSTSATDLALGQLPGGAPTTWWTAAVLAIGLLALLVPGRRAGSWLAGLVGLLGLAWALGAPHLVLGHRPAGAPDPGAALTAWAGLGQIVLVGAALVAVVQLQCMFVTDGAAQHGQPPRCLEDEPPDGERERRHADGGEDARVADEGHERDPEGHVGGQHGRRGEGEQARRERENSDAGPCPPPGGRGRRGRRLGAVGVGPIGGLPGTDRPHDCDEEREDDREDDVEPEDGAPVGDREDRRPEHRAQDRPDLLHRADHPQRHPSLPGRPQIRDERQRRRHEPAAAGALDDPAGDEDGQLDRDGRHRRADGEGDEAPQEDPAAIDEVGQAPDERQHRDVPQEEAGQDRGRPLQRVEPDPDAGHHVREGEDDDVRVGRGEGHGHGGDPEQHDLKAAIAAHHGVKIDNVAIDSS